jgi:hypothetical protein
VLAAVTVAAAVVTASAPCCCWGRATHRSGVELPHFDPGNPPLLLPFSPLHVCPAFTPLLFCRELEVLDMRRLSSGYIRNGGGWPAGEVEALNSSCVSNASHVSHASW